MVFQCYLESALLLVVAHDADLDDVGQQVGRVVLALQILHQRRRRVQKVQWDQFNMVMFFWYSIKVACPMFTTVHVYTGQVTNSKVPEKHGHV